MASASDSHSEAVFSAAEDGGLDVRDLSGSDNEGGSRGSGSVESEISDVGL